MKTLLYIFIFACCTFLSCSSDDNEDENIYIGTTWEYTQDDDTSDDSYLIHTLHFSSNKECTLTLKGYLSMEIFFEHKYTYSIINNNKLLLTPKQDSRPIYNVKISGESMTLIDNSTNKEFVTLIKTN